MIEWLAETVETYQPTGTLSDLVPSVRPEFDALVAQATAWSMQPKVRSVGRTCAQQAEQVKLGYSHADLCRSMHVLGHAVDLDLSPNSCATYTKLGQWWESRGGVWGGRWAQFGPCGDSGHFHYGFNGAGAVPTSECPSGVTLAECSKIREAYLDQAFGEGPQVSSRWGLVAGLAIVAVGVGFVWATMRVRPRVFAFKANPFISPTSSTFSESGYVYHATNEDRVRDIAREGIKTHKPWDFTEQDSWPDGSTEKRSYFSRSASSVWAFAPEEGRAVILRTRETSQFKREGTGDIYTTKSVPASKLEVLTDEGWVPLSKAGA